MPEFKPGYEPHVQYAQDSGRMMLYIGLDGKISLDGEVLYPYLPQQTKNKQRDHSQGSASITRLSVGRDLQEEDGLMSLDAIFATFLRNISSLSARKLTFSLRDTYPDWLIDGLLAFFERHRLELTNIRSGVSNSTVSNDAFRGNVRRYLPSTLTIEVTNPARFQVQEVLAAV